MDPCERDLRKRVPSWLFMDTLDIVVVGGSCFVVACQTVMIKGGVFLMLPVLMSHFIILILKMRSVLIVISSPHWTCLLFRTDGSVTLATFHSGTGHARERVLLTRDAPVVKFWADAHV